MQGEGTSTALMIASCAGPADTIFGAAAGPVMEEGSLISRHISVEPIKAGQQVSRTTAAPDGRSLTSEMLPAHAVAAFSRVMLIWNLSTRTNASAPVIVLQVTYSAASTTPRLPDIRLPRICRRTPKETVPAPVRLLRRNLCRPTMPLHNLRQQTTGQVH